MIQLKAVIFDYGNVLCEAQKTDDLAAMAREFGLPLVRFEELYWRRRLAYDLSELTSGAYWDDFSGMAGATLPAEGLRRVMDLDNASWAHPNKPMIAWAKELRAKGLRTAVLSNMPLPLREYLDTECPWFPEFDHRTFSCDVKMAKPEAGIYEECLRGLKVEAGETLFLDDRPDNIRAAREMGIHALLFSEARDAAAELKGRYSLPPLLLH